MKTKYLVESLRNNILFAMLMSFLFVAGVMADEMVIETTVFEDDFSGANLAGGNPQTTYNILKITGSGDDAADPTTTTTAGLLRIPNRKGTGFYGRNGVFGDLSVYASPFRSKLSTTEVDSIVWTFNMRQNYNSTLSGFDDVQNGIGAILLTDKDDYTSGNGYAVVYGQTAVGKVYRLVSFTDGINANSKITSIVLGDVSSSDGREYMSFRVVYISSTNTWILNGRFDGPNSGSFADPTQGTFDYSYSGINSDWVDTEMTNFGFFQNYSSNIDKIMWVDNYSVKAYETDLGTRVVVGENSSTNWNYIRNGIKITTPDALVTLYDLTGSVVQTVQVNNQADIRLAVPGMYVMKVQPAHGKANVEKILIK